jgi:hypothetical protein
MVLPNNGLTVLQVKENPTLEKSGLRKGENKDSSNQASAEIVAQVTATTITMQKKQQHL